MLQTKKPELLIQVPLLLVKWPDIHGTCSTQRRQQIEKKRFWKKRGEILTKSFPRERNKIISQTEHKPTKEMWTYKDQLLVGISEDNHRISKSLFVLRFLYAKLDV